MVTAPGWHVERSNYFRQPRTLAENTSCDTAIIGGGIVGLALAYHLSKHQRVVVIEAKEIGSGSSGWNAGILSLSTSLDLAVLEETVGREKAELLAARLATTLDTTRKDLQLSSDVWQVGRSLFAAARRTHHKLLVEERATQEDFGFESALMGKLELSSYWKGFCSALALMQEHAVHPYRLLLSLAAATESHGASLFENSPATQWDANEEGAVITANGFTIKARNLVVATGVAGLEKDFERDIRRKSIAITGQVAVTEPSEHVRQLIEKTGTLALWDSFLFYHYVHYLPDGRILIGSGDSAGRARNKVLKTDAKSVGELVKWLERHHSFAIPPIQSAWQASLIYPLDGMPLLADKQIGKTRLIHAVTDGLPFGLLIGKALADDVLGDDTNDSRAVLEAIKGRHDPTGLEGVLAKLPENATIRNLAVRIGMLGLKLQDLISC